MLIDLHETQVYVLKILEMFAVALKKKQGISIELINIINHPYLEDINTNSSDVVAIKVIDYGRLGNRELRSGGFYDSVNEYELMISLYFICFITKENAVNQIDLLNRMTLIYQEYNSFLHNNSNIFKFSKAVDKEYVLRLKYILRHIGRFALKDPITVKSKYSNKAISTNIITKVNVQVIEEKITSTQK
ncbi:hypothetical protein DB313_05755 (plasmid) [Borrelia turcica IST7]|uniref:Uncharacterized protein n=1 Tax=Borrelia turcica IST7 TaxID=1104446 RepID=A0A386PNF3_9SPIR|nr:DUF764 family protein [Borrelia turcica]AYE37004.1 hypothetical protein DB313_05755 [Borrelia turcica IST7]